MTNTAHIHAKHLQLNITTKKLHMLRNKFFLLNVYHCHHFPSSLMFFLAMYSNQEHFSSHPISHPGPAHLHQVPPASHHYLTREAPYLLHAGASRLASLPHTRAPHTCTRCLPPRITKSHGGPAPTTHRCLRLALLPQTRAPHTCTRCLPPRINTSHGGPRTCYTQVPSA